MTETRRSDCPIASTLDIVGDRWTLVIVRDLINGKKKFADFMESPEKITSSVLAARLTMLEKVGLVEKEAYQLRPKRYAYQLTESGYSLLPVLQAMCIWGNRFLEDTWVAPETFMNLKP